MVDYELVDYIRALRPKYRTALLSNAWDNLRSVLTDTWKIADAFNCLTISAEEGIMKPDAQIYQIALDRAGVAPDEAVFVDDFAHNIQGARAVGMHGIHFLNPDQALNDLKGLLNYSG
jgi:putative hydrolase of the HAD superfamily